MNSNEIKWVQMTSIEFKWDQTNLNQINDQFTRIQMKSARISEKIFKIYGELTYTPMDRSCLPKFRE